MKDHDRFYEAECSLLVCHKVNFIVNFHYFIIFHWQSNIKNRKINILELKFKTLGNYSFDANRRQTFDSSAKKYLYEPFLWRSPIVSLIDNGAIEAYKDDERPNGWCF